MRMGSKLAKQIKEINPDHDIDVVIPIPDSSITAAHQLAVDLKVPYSCLLYTSPSPRDGQISRMPSSA